MHTLMYLCAVIVVHNVMYALTVVHSVMYALTAEDCNYYICEIRKVNA